MFEDFQNLKFSLTRFHQITQFYNLLSKSKSNNLRDMLKESGIERDDNDLAPEMRLLCVKNKNEKIADYWNVARKEPRLLQLTIALSVIFSHHTLLNIFYNCEKISHLSGKIKRVDIENYFSEKNFTNLKTAFLHHFFVGLSEDKDTFTWLFKDLLSFKEFPKVFLDLIEARFRYMGIAYNKDDIPGEILKRELHKVIGLDEAILNKSMIFTDEFERKFKKDNMTGYMKSDKRLIYPIQRILYGAPGTGKSFQLQEDIDKSRESISRTERVTFHPDYSYYDFIGSYKPVPIFQKSSEELYRLDGKKHEHGKPMISYEFQPGPFLQCLLDALMNPENNFVFIIEEINRGSAAAIFGDTFQLLDRNGEGKSRYQITPSTEIDAYLSLNNYPIKTLLFPKNFYIWATMNNSDQGVTPLDTAFKRRWSFEYTDINAPSVLDHILLKYDGESIMWVDFRRKINDKLINLDVNEDKLIGPYFLTQTQIENPSEVAGKLFLYLWDDVLRHRQELLFKEKSFSNLLIKWNNGEGAPMALDFE